ncbi:MAG: ATP-binding protein [Pseudomonadota bacterium]
MIPNHPDYLHYPPTERCKLHPNLLHTRTILLSDLIERAVQASLPCIEQRQQQLQLNQSLSALLVMGNLDWLTQLLFNLLTNASKYTPDRGHIVITVLQKGDAVQVLIADDGAGIPPALHLAIFDRSAHGFRARNLGPGKPGNGLALAMLIVEMHGGTLAVRSEGDGRGSEFTVSLPLLDRPRQAFCHGQAAHDALPLIA